MEIERKWMVKGWPEGLVPLREFEMEQGYISVHPTVRIRKEAHVGGKTEYILCFKSRSGDGGLSRKEIEMEIGSEKFEELRELLGMPLITKQRRDYRLPDGHMLEVSLVDEGLPTEFMYAEVEYACDEEAKGWQPADCGLEDFLSDEVTFQKGQSMGAYWLQTRGKFKG